MKIVLGALVVVLLLFAVMFFAGDGEPTGQAITRGQVGPEWPFTVSHGVVYCIDEREFIFETGGKKYPLNGWAMTFADRKGYEKRLDPIWLENTEYPGLGLRVSTGAVESIAERLC